MVKHTRTEREGACTWCVHMTWDGRGMFVRVRRTEICMQRMLHWAKEKHIDLLEETSTTVSVNKKKTTRFFKTNSGETVDYERST